MYHLKIVLYKDIQDTIEELKKHCINYRISYYDSQVNIYIQNESIDALVDLMKKMEAEGFTRLRNTIYEK